MKTTIESLRSEGKTVKEVCATLNITKGEYYKILKAVEEVPVVEELTEEAVNVIIDAEQEAVADVKKAAKKARAEKAKAEKAAKEPKPDKETKSKLFIEMYQAGKTITEIAKETHSQYSFVYGVIDRKIGLVRIEKPQRSEAIRELAAQGKTPGQIAKELNANYSFVHTVVKKYKASLAQ